MQWKKTKTATHFKIGNAKSEFSNQETADIWIPCNSKDVGATAKTLFDIPKTHFALVKLTWVSSTC
jgi:hypothetical protein